MTIWRLAGSTGWFLAASAAAQAATIDINGVWGNKGGCEYARGIYNSDSGVLLRRDKLEGTEFMCEFTDVRKGSDGSFTVRAQCAQEGRLRITIGPDRNGARSIKADKGWTFSDVRRCR